MICALGDAHLDVVVTISGPVALDTDTPARTRVTTGGQAANVAAWVAALGGRSRLIAARATDAAALLVAGDLAGRGVDLVGPVIGGRTGVVVSLSDGGSHRSMLTDRGVGPAGKPDPGWLDGGVAASARVQPIQRAGAGLTLAARRPRGAGRRG